MDECGHGAGCFDGAPDRKGERRQPVTRRPGVSIGGNHIPLLCIGQSRGVSAGDQMLAEREAHPFGPAYETWALLKKENLHDSQNREKALGA
jgi:hypothetical protein